MYENKTNKCHEIIRIYYIIIVVIFLYVSVTFCGHLQGVFLERVYYKDNQGTVPIKILSFKYMFHNICYNTQCRKNICTKFTWVRSLHVQDGDTTHTHINTP
jgi:hypothetical protein